MFTCCYDSKHHGVMCTALSVNDQLFELYDGNVVAETSIVTVLGLTVKYLVRSDQGSLIICRSSSLWIPTGLGQPIRVDSEGEIKGNASLVGSLAGFCDANGSRIVDVTRNESIWAKEGQFEAIAFCQRDHHIATGSKKSVSVFPCKAGLRVPPSDMKGIAVHSSGTCSGLEWACLQDDSVLAIFQNNNTVVDLYCLVSEPGDAFGSGTLDNPFHQLLHVSCMRFPQASLPTIVPQNVTGSKGSLPSRLTIMHWEDPSHIRWSSFRFSQHSVPQQDAGGRVQVGCILKECAPITYSVQSVAVMPCFIDREAVVTPGGSWEKSHAASVQMYVSLDTGAIISIVVDHGASTASLDQVVCDGMLRSQSAIAASWSNFFARVEVSSCGLVKSSLFLRSLEAPGLFGVRLVGLKFTTHGKDLRECRLHQSESFLTLMNGDLEISRFEFPVEPGAPQQTKSCAHVNELVVQLHPVLCVELGNKRRLTTPQPLTFGCEAKVLTSHVSRESGLVVVCLHHQLSLTIVSWDLIISEDPSVVNYNDVVCATSHPDSNDLVFMRTSGCVVVHHWISGIVEQIAILDVANDNPNIVALGADCVGVVSCGLVSLISLTASEPSPILLNQFRECARCLDWKQVNVMLDALSIEKVTTSDEAALQLVQEQGGQSMWSSTLSGAEGARLHVVDAHHLPEWRPGENHIDNIDAGVLESVSNHLMNVQIHGLNSSQQLELLSIVEAVRSSRSAIEPLRDQAAARVVFALEEKEVRRHLRLPGMVLPWLTALWAALSDSQDVLFQHAIKLIEKKPGGGWEEASATKISFWCKSLQMLRTVTDCVARQQYHAHREVRDCALMYLLAGKKSTLIALCKAANDMRLHQFFSRNFSEEKNRSSAVSNAYAALGKGSVALGAAFFVLAGDAKSAAQVVLDRLGDLQLSMCIIRLSTDDDSSSIQWLLDTARDKGPPVTPFMNSIFLFRKGDHVEAMRIISLDDRLGENETDVFEIVELLQFASSRVVLLSRRSSEFFDASTQMTLLCRIFRITQPHHTFYWRRSGARIALSDSVNKLKQQLQQNTKSIDVRHSQGEFRQTVGTADFASGTVQFIDSDDDCGDDPSCALPTEKSDDGGLEEADGQRAAAAEQKRRLEIVEEILRTTDLCKPMADAADEQQLLAWLVTNTATLEGGSCKGGVSDRQLTAVLSALVNTTVDPTVSKEIICPALLLLLIKRCLRSEDVALAIAVVSCCNMWCRAAPCACGHRTLVDELWGSKLQAMERAAMLPDGELSPIAFKCDEDTAPNDVMGRCLLQLATVNVCSMILRRLQSSKGTDVPRYLWARNATAYNATAMLRNAEDVLIVKASKSPRDETLTFVLQCRGAKQYLRSLRVASELNKPLIDSSHHQARFSKYMDTFAACFTAPHRVPSLVLPPSGVPIDRQPWFKQLRSKCKILPSPDELFAMTTEDESVLRWFHYVWSLRNHRFGEARRFLVDQAFATDSALLSPHFFHTDSHAISTLVVDHSTCDNIAVGTAAKTSLVHGLRELLAGDNGVYLEQRAAERNASLESFASWVSAMPSTSTVRSNNRNALGASAKGKLASHPHLPFFVVSQQDGHLDVFNFGDLDCVATFSLDHNSMKLSGSVVDTWLPPVFSPNGYFLSMGQRGTGEIMSLKFEDVITSSGMHTAATLGRKAHAFSGSCTSVIHVAPYSAIVLAAGSDVNQQSLKATSSSTKKGAQNFVRIIDPLVTKSTLLSCEIPHEVDFLFFDAAKRQALCASENGLMSLYDARKNGIVSTLGLGSGGLTPPRQIGGGKQSQSAASRGVSITAMAQIVDDDLLVVGLSNGTVMLLPHCIPDIAAFDGGFSDDIANTSAAAVSVVAHASRPAPVTALVGTPSAILCGLGDGKVCAIPIIPDAVKKQILRE